MTDKQNLKLLLLNKSYKYRDNPPFTLRSGRTSPHYVDCKLTTCDPYGLYWVGKIVYDMVKGLYIQAIGGLTMGADPIAYATALTSFPSKAHSPIRAFSVRKKEKDHGTKRLIEGDVRLGDRVVIVDDVITTGGSTIQAIEAARGFGLIVVKVVVIVDRQEGGKEEIQKHVPIVESIFTLDELKKE